MEQCHELFAALGRTFEQECRSGVNSGPVYVLNRSYTSSMSLERIGLFGGTFDPPHLGHLILASEAQHQLDLTRMLWTLTPDPPHKQGQNIMSVEHRLAMVNLSIADNPLFELSRIELERPGPHYTLDTVRTLRAEYPGAEIVPVIGGDSLRELPKWHQPGELLAACSQIGVMRRPGEPTDLRSDRKSVV